MKIAVIGSGISGLGVAYILGFSHDVTLYEKNDYLGGHSRTIDVAVPEGIVPVDTGFIVFNRKNYPHLVNFFKHLNVQTDKSDMSFGASIANGWLEYGSKSMFSQSKNFFRKEYWKMIFDIIRFNKQAIKYLDHYQDATLKECLDFLKMGDWFNRYYLQAMGAAIWSCSVETILKFPARTFIKFFDNHGLLTVNAHPQWETVVGGSREYIKKITQSLKAEIKISTVVLKVSEHQNGFIIEDSKGQSEFYDKVVFASHADQTLRVIENPTEDEKNILGSFSYQKNKVVVHSDQSFMPKNKGAWASWVYLSEKTNDMSDSVSLSYWMNNLQKLKTKKNIFVTLNPGRMPEPEMIYDEHVFDHPIFTKEAVNAQPRINDIQGVRGLYFCGAYQRYGFHEDGLMSAVSVAKRIGATIPWEKA